MREEVDMGTRSREHVEEALVRELVGPAPAGPAVDLGAPFPTKKDSYGPFVDAETGEEVLAWTRPVKRYGVGVLFPDSEREQGGMAAVTGDGDERASDDALSTSTDAELTERGEADLRTVASRGGADTESESLDLTAANLRRPSTMAVSLLLRPVEGARVVVTANGATYQPRKVDIAEQPGETRTVHVRSPWSVVASEPVEALLADVGTRHLPVRRAAEPEHLMPSLEVTVRPPRDDGASLVTIALVNRSRSGELDGRVFFQVGFEVAVEDRDGSPVDAIGPYPGPPITELDPEERSLALLHRKATTFGVGHGCSADWDAEEGRSAVSRVRAEPLPVVEVPSTTPDVHRADGTKLEVPMAPLAGLLPGEDGRASLEELVDAYASWLEGRRREAQHVAPELRATAAAHLEACARVLARMRRGVELLATDPQVRRAFELANRAILVQQLRSELPARDVEKVSSRGAPAYSVRAPVVDELGGVGQRGRWRPFQLGFMLASLASTADPRDEDRETVELIFFPTGGGKTEAYLGLASFSMFLRRLRDPSDAGVDVLMRYTLRLLTAQQFLRASRLICAMEDLRRRFERELGHAPFTIGIWLGGATTPNKREQAVRALRRLVRDPAGAENPFLLARCPWCAAELGPVRAGKRNPSVILGYEERGGTVAIVCPDDTCAFASGLPVMLIDEDVYRDRPSMVIGTVDKFAQLTWRDDARSLFGIGDDGRRRWSPPNLIVQDELHLISGPLGSMVGLYEMVVEDLCTDERRGARHLPKLVTSTATIRGYAHQVRALFGREATALFPPHGLHADDSFFARYARDERGELLPGRRYVGVHAGNHSSLIETQVATMAALLQAGRALPEDERDPWWTQLIFFNTLRDLGTSLSLAQSNVPMQLRAVGQREGIPPAELRRIDHVIELTSRLRNDEVPRAIASLERRSGEERPVDLCLASNIIEVGIDIDRLSLMVVVGQPKTTSQYIQVTGRIGRRWWERPGLVVSLLNPNRSRDRSHYERFRSYHSRLYAQVEPTSVTPFSPAAVDRALHGALVAYVRQRTDVTAVHGPSAVPNELLTSFEELARRRVTIVDPLEATSLEHALETRLAEWRSWSRLRWEAELSGEDGLLVRAGDQAGSDPGDALHWQAPTSMRSVDAECELAVTLEYAKARAAAAKEAARG
jgi:hypothetical protein